MVSNYYFKLLFNTRSLLPLMIGIIVGFAFSLLCTPLFDCQNLFGKHQLLGTVQSQENLNLLEQQKQADEFEPRINLQGKPKKPQKAVQKLIRPRYASTELNIKYKLFVGIISTSKILTSLAAFYNQTITPYANKLTFFVNNADMNEKLLLETTPPGLNVVNFNDDRDNLLPFHSLKYVFDNYIQDYDWFFFITDNSFVRIAKLLDLVNHLSISQSLYMGYSKVGEQSVYCHLTSGILFSNSILTKVLNKMEWCTKNAYSDDPSDNLGRCVLHSTNIKCTNVVDAHNLTYFNSLSFNFDTEIDELIKKDIFNRTLTVHRVNDIETMKKLQLYFDYIEMSELDEQIGKVEENIFETVCHTPLGCDSLIWPMGVPPPYKPLTRHEILRYDYFNQTHIFLSGDFDVINELTENYKQDVSEVLEFSLLNLNKKIPERYVLLKLLNGYKQFDPTRGATYVLDLLVYDHVQRIDVHKRVNVMRPLGLIELMPMPYVTENAKVNLVLTLSSDKSLKQIDEFFAMYKKYILENKDAAEKINLYIVHLSMGTNWQQADKNITAHINETIKELSKKYSSLLKTSSKISQLEGAFANSTMYAMNGYRQMLVAELISKKMNKDELIVLVDACAEIQSDFLNRVRLNTIKGTQVFFPIPFKQYMPNIVYAAKPFPIEVEINKNYGFFNMHSYEYAAYFNSDYLSTRKHFVRDVLKSNLKEKDYGKVSVENYVDDLYEFFSLNKQLNILRATDQSLKCRWQTSNNCAIRAHKENEYKRCLLESEKSLGTKAQLAMHLMKNYDLINKNSNV